MQNLELLTFSLHKHRRFLFWLIANTPQKIWEVAKIFDHPRLCLKSRLPTKISESFVGSSGSGGTQKEFDGSKAAQLLFLHTWDLDIVDWVEHYTAVVGNVHCIEFAEYPERYIEMVVDIHNQADHYTGPAVNIRAN